MKKNTAIPLGTLNLFTPWDLRQQSPSVRQWWQLHHYQPKAGLLTQQNSELGFNLDTTFKPNDHYDATRLYVMASGSVLFIQALNDQTQEALLYSPHLPDSPWIKDRWYLVDQHDLSPVTIWGFDETYFREQHPEKPCPYPIRWGAYSDAYNRRRYEWEARQGGKNQ